MKKLFTLVLTLAALLSSTKTWAESYGITVAGVSVTDANASNITGTGISGTIKYNASSKRLIIAAGTTIDTTHDGINNRDVDGLEILFEGAVTINTSCTTSSAAAICCLKSTTLSCWSSDPSPVVKLNNTGAGAAIVCHYGSNLSAYGLRITAKSSNNNGVYATNGGRMNLYHTQLISTGGSGLAGITGFSGGINLTGSVAYRQTISGGSVMQDGSVAQTANIYPAVKIGNLNVSATSTKTLNTTNTGATSASGTAKYDASTNTLTLTNVNIDGAYLTTYGDMTVNFVGGGTISSAGYSADLYGNTKLTSDGTVTIKTTGRTAVYGNNGSSIEISMPDFIASSTASGNYQGLYTSGKLIVTKYNDGSYYKFSGPQYNFRVGSVVMNDMDVWTSDTYIKNGIPYYRTEAANSSNCSQSSFKTVTACTPYYTNLYVAGTRVRTDCAQYIYSPYMSSLASYDTSTKTLTLTDATISGQPSDGAAETRSAIYSTISGLTINATGTNNWTSDWVTVNLGGGGTNTIKGTGDLLITSNQYHAMNAWNNTGITLARSSGSMSLKGKDRGIYGNNTTTLTINKDGSGALYKFAGEQGNITNLSSLTFGSGVNIWTLYQYFNAEDKAIYSRNAVAKSSSFDDATWIRSDVTWTTYPIYIAGTQLYGAPKGDGTYRGNIGGFWSKYVKGGTITYDPSTKTLTLNGATIESVGSHGIEMKLEGNIKLVGTNSLSAKTTTNSMYSAICANKFNITITGDGSLNATSDKNCGIHAHEGIVTITDNVKIDATGDCGGLGSISSDYAGTFIISGNAQVKSNKITNVATLTLEDGQAIVEPFKAAFNSSNKRVEVNGAVAQNVVIQKVEKYDLAICDIDVNSYNKDDILRDGGSFKYEPNTKRLTITNANVDDTSVEEGIWNKGIEGLNIAINGENNLKFYEDVFRLAKSTTFSGSGSVKGELTSSTGFGFYLPVDGIICNLNGPKFEFTGKQAVGDGGFDANLIFEKGCMIFNPINSNSKIFNIKNLTLGEGMIIAEPKGGTFSSSSKGIVVNGSLYYGHAVISMKGDVNLDGQVTIADGVAVLNAMAGDAVAGDADVNGDGELGIADFVAVLNIMAN